MLREIDGTRELVQAGWQKRQSSRALSDPFDLSSFFHAHASLLEAAHSRLFTFAVTLLALVRSHRQAHKAERRLAGGKGVGIKVV